MEPIDKTRILKEMQAGLESEPRINLHRCPIRLSFSNDDLVLEGEVENIVAKKLALEMAGAVPGIGNVVDRLRVAPAARMGDGEVRDHVCKALMQEPAFAAHTVRAQAEGEVEAFGEPIAKPEADIQVEVKDGVVILNGQVPSLSHKRLAGVLAWWVPGTRDVINGLEEVPPETDSDGEVTDAVTLVLEKDPFIRSGQVHVTTRDFVVTLEGVIATEQLKEMAEFDAWYVFRVNRVINNLKVRE